MCSPMVFRANKYPPQKNKYKKVTNHYKQERKDGAYKQINMKRNLERKRDCGAVFSFCLTDEKIYNYSNMTEETMAITDHR